MTRGARTIVGSVRLLRHTLHCGRRFETLMEDRQWQVRHQLPCQQINAEAALER